MSSTGRLIIELRNAPDTFARLVDGEPESRSCP
jgi:hypothetical protein